MAKHDITPAMVARCRELTVRLKLRPLVYGKLYDEFGVDRETARAVWDAMCQEVAAEMRAYVKARRR